MRYFRTRYFSRYILWVLLVVIGAGGVLISVKFWVFRQEKLRKVLAPNMMAIQAVAPKHWPADKANHSPPIKVILFGDSRIEEWSSAWPTDVHVINQGISGSTTAESVQRFRQDVVSLKPTWLVLQVGINDIVASRLVGQNTRRSIENRVIENTLTLLREGLNHNIRIIYFSILPAIKPDALRAFVWQGDLRQAVARVNRGIKTGIHQLRMEGEVRQNKNGLFEVNTEQLFTQFQAAQTASSRRRWQRDALHWTPDAYQYLQRQVVDILQ